MVMMLPRDVSLSSLSVYSVDITCHEIRCVTILNAILWFFFIIIFIIIIFRARKVLRDVRGLWRASQRTSVWPPLSSTAFPWQLLLVGFNRICKCIFSFACLWQLLWFGDIRICIYSTASPLPLLLVSFFMCLSPCPQLDLTLVQFPTSPKNTGLKTNPQVMKAAYLEPPLGNLSL